MTSYFKNKPSSITRKSRKVRRSRFNIHEINWEVDEILSLLTDIENEITLNGLSKDNFDNILSSALVCMEFVKCYVSGNRERFHYPSDFSRVEELRKFTKGLYEVCLEIYIHFDDLTDRVEYEYEFLGARAYIDIIHEQFLL